MQISNCDIYSPALLDLFWASDPRLYSAVTLPPLENSDHVVVSVYINCPVMSKGDTFIHCWDLCFCAVSGITWEEILIWILLLLVCYLSKKHDSRNFCQIVNSVFSKGKFALSPLFNALKVLTSVSSMKLFCEIFTENSNLDHSSISLPDDLPKNWSEAEYYLFNYQTVFEDHSCSRFF